MALSFTATEFSPSIEASSCSSVAGQPFNSASPSQTTNSALNGSITVIVVPLISLLLLSVAVVVTTTVIIVCLLKRYKERGPSTTDVKLSKIDHIDNPVYTTGINFYIATLHDNGQLLAVSY